LLALLEDENEDVVASAVYALGQIGDSSVGAKLLPFLDYPDRPHVKVRRVAIEALRALKYQPAIPHLCRLLHDPDSGIRYEVMLTLFGMRHVSDEIEDILKSIVNDPDAPWRENAQMMLDIITDEQ
jgi:HEAT repeat protein